MRFDHFIMQSGARASSRLQPEKNIHTHTQLELSAERAELLPVFLPSATYQIGLIYTSKTYHPSTFPNNSFVLLLCKHWH